MALVEGYTSDSSEAGQREDHEPENGKASSSEDSYFVGSDYESDDSATKRRKAAEARLRDHNEEVAGPSAAALPCPLDVIGIASRPKFLDPEATRPLAAPIHRNRAPLTKTVQPTLSQRNEDKGWDIASMAPKLKNNPDKRPSGAVISAAAKRYKTDDRVDSGVVTAAQVAMLGGQWRPTADEEAGEGEDEAPAKKAKGPSKAMPVADFLATGDAGTLLPRTKQDRRDREKEKRAKGQSSIHGWKTEAEMVLRQQYD